MLALGRNGAKAQTASARSASSAREHAWLRQCDNPCMNTPESELPGPDAAESSARLSLHVNGKPYVHRGDGQMPLLWYLRDVLRLTGTKYACDCQSCGACLVLVDDKPVKACVVRMAELRDKQVVTIEGVAGERLHPVQSAFLDEDVGHCGYCHSGQIIAAIDLLRRKKQPAQADIRQIENMCRCGAQERISKAILAAAKAIVDERSG